MGLFDKLLPGLLGGASGFLSGGPVGALVGAGLGLAGGGSPKSSSPRALGVGNGADFDVSDFLGKYGKDIFGAGTGLYGLYSTNQQSKRARRAAGDRENRILGMLSGQGAASKAEVLRSGAQERDALRQNLISRGLFNSTLADTLDNASYEREGRQSAAIDEAVANRMAGVVGDTHEVGPDTGSMNQMLQSLGTSLFTGRAAPQNGQTGGSVADDLLGAYGSRTPARAMGDTGAGGVFAQRAPQKAVGYGTAGGGGVDAKELLAMLTQAKSGGGIWRR